MSNKDNYIHGNIGYSFPTVIRRVELVDADLEKIRQIVREELQRDEDRVEPHIVTVQGKHLDREEQLTALLKAYRRLLQGHDPCPPEVTDSTTYLTPYERTYIEVEEQYKQLVLGISE